MLLVPATAFAMPHVVVPTSARQLEAIRTLIPTSASSVSHVLVHQGALVDLVGVWWGKVGAPPFRAAEAIFQGRQVESVGPFTDGSYFFSPDAALGVNTAFLITVVCSIAPSGDNGILLEKGHYPGPGFSLHLETSPALTYIHLGASGVTTKQLGAGVHVISFGWDGVSFFSQADLAAWSSAYQAFAPDTANEMRIGRASVAGYPATGHLYEYRFTRGAFTAVDVTALHTAILAASATN